MRYESDDEKVTFKRIKNMEWKERNLKKKVNTAVENIGRHIQRAALKGQTAANTLLVARYIKAGSDE